MHKITEKEFTLEDFSHEHMDIASEACLETTIGYLNLFRQSFLENHDKDIWWQMIQLLPSSYNQTRNVMLNYEVLSNIYKSRKNHKLDEWKVHETPEEDKFRNKDFASGKWGFCDWIESLPHSELIVGAASTSIQNSVSPGKLNIRWAEDIFKNHGIKLTEEQINIINAISTTNNSEI